MKTLLVFLSISLMTILFPNKSNAQTQDPYFPKLSIGLSPSSLFNVYSGMQASLDIKVAERWNSASEFTYIFGLLDTPGFRIKSGLHYQLKNYKTVSLNFGPNLLYQRVKTGRGLNAFLLAYGYESDIYYNQNRIAGELMFSLRKYFTPRFFMEFGLGAGLHYTDYNITARSEDNLRKLITDSQTDTTFEEMSHIVEAGLLPSFNLNLSFVIAQ
jgi:chloramphenicol O-acetyltransferase